ncbi:MAG: hypothetical protein RBR35_18775 [Salinivirgaceae bacterium]|nr:hypothetical protein [Salinivirgaceae bacterium]
MPEGGGTLTVCCLGKGISVENKFVREVNGKVLHILWRKARIQEPGTCHSAVAHSDDGRPESYSLPREKMDQFNTGQEGVLFQFLHIPRV